jgi:hypothetical protein
MGCFDVVSNLTHLAGLADWLHGCSHRRTTFPITLRTERKRRWTSERAIGDLRRLLGVRTPLCV